MESVIIEYISTELVSDPDVLPLDVDTPLMDSNIIDSVAFLNLVMFLEERFGISVADTDLTRQNFDTVTAMCAYVRSQAPDADRMAS